MKNDILKDDLVWLSVYMPTTECPLKPRDLLVYSFLASEARKGRDPLPRRVGTATGVSYPTSVANSLHELLIQGLRDDLLSPPPGWFVEYDGSGGITEGCAWWICYVRGNQSPLSLEATVIYCWVRHLTLQGKMPPSGFSPTLISNILNVSRNTARKAWELCVTEGLFSDTGVYGELSDRQRDFFVPQKTDTSVAMEFHLPAEKEAAEKEAEEKTQRLAEAYVAQWRERCEALAIPAPKIEKMIGTARRLAYRGYPPAKLFDRHGIQEVIEGMPPGPDGADVVCLKMHQLMSREIDGLLR